MKVTRIGLGRSMNIEAEHVTVEVSGVKYRLSQSVDNKLQVNAGEVLCVFPRYSNEVELQGVER